WRCRTGRPWLGGRFPTVPERAATLLLIQLLRHDRPCETLMSRERNPARAGRVLPHDGARPGGGVKALLGGWVAEALMMIFRRGTPLVPTKAGTGANGASAHLLRRERHHQRDHACAALTVAAAARESRHPLIVETQLALDVVKLATEVLASHGPAL